MVVLSKSKYMIGLSCPKHLWCLFNEPSLIPPFDEGTLARFEQGHEIGAIAKLRYPSGVEIPFTKEALKETAKMLLKKVPLFEATFCHKNSYCKVDILVPVDDECWDLIEVKSTTEVKEDHIPDVAFQRYCLEGTGIKINRCHLMFVNNEYVRKGAIDPNLILSCEDITSQVDAEVLNVEENISDMLRVIALKKMPSPSLGDECVEPSECPVCCTDLPPHSVTELYRMGKKAYPLMNEGYAKILDLPAGSKLNDKQKIQVSCIKSGKAHVEPKLISSWLSKLKYPLYMIDFETVNPAVPLFDGMRPYQQLPFQVSIHKVDSTGKIEHIEYLASSKKDCRAEVMEVLRKIGPSGTVLAYNATFEKSRINELIEMFPSETWLEGLIDRMEDLAVPFSNFWYYHPSQHGKYSIKNVMPALTGISYEGLEIGKGDQAAREFLEVIFKGNPKGKDVGKVRRALLEYCGQDTEGMVRVLGVLKDLK